MEGTYCKLLRQRRRYRIYSLAKRIVVFDWKISDAVARHALGNETLCNRTHAVTAPVVPNSVPFFPPFVLFTRIFFFPKLPRPDDQTIFNGATICVTRYE